uniref:50S ribosomal protein L12, chloroplastic n=1 Tax=Riquetophycus sp. TaxID=1897556 RepID=A0A1C9C8E1_9FLOR|nr:ribosomal protein L12 [Riquetophycus sp.]
MNNKITLIIDELKSLTLLEAAELVKQIEETFGVDASASVSNMSVIPNDISNSVINKQEEKTEFSLVLEQVPVSKKIPILKVVRALTGLGLKEAKDLVESAPKVLKEGASKEDAQEIKSQLEEVGAQVSIK